MNSWSRNRKRLIFSIVMLGLVILVGLPLYFLFYQAPTCFDDKQNGSETGIDCGGSCQLLCTDDSLPLILKGDPQVLELTDQTFAVVALVENPNASGEIYRAGYTFKLYSASSSIPIKTIENQTYVPKGITFAIFEGPLSIESGNIPTRAVLEWKSESLMWRQNILPPPSLVVKELNLSRASTTPRLDAVIENVTLENVAYIDLVATLSDETGSIFAASKTFIDTLPAGSKVPIVFTWPKPFKKKVVDIEVIVRVLPDGSFIR